MTASRPAVDPTGAAHGRCRCARLSFRGSGQNTGGDEAVGALARIIGGSSARCERQGSVIKPLHAMRNMRLVLGAVVQHLRDDPALFVVQLSRRLPLGARTRSGRVLAVVGSSAHRGEGMAALGRLMAGDVAGAVAIVEEGRHSRSRLLGEVAVLCDRVDLLSESSHATTRARARWMSGDLTGAVSELERAGLSKTEQAHRLANELDLLEEGFRLPVEAGSATTEQGAERGLRVLHLITNSLPHTQSGYAVRTHNILTALRERGVESIALSRTGYPVMIGKPFCEDEDVIDGIRYRRTLPRALGSTPQDRLEQEVSEAILIVDEFRPNVIHATTDYRNALVAQAVSIATGIPWILEVRGLMEQTWIASHQNEASRLAASASEKVARIVATESSLAQEASAVVTLSRSMAEVLERRGVPAERVTLVPNGVDETLLDENLSVIEARARLEVDLPRDALVVGSASALVDYEGFDDLLDAAAMLISDPCSPRAVRERLHVVLAGDGVSAQALRAQSKALGIQDRVHLPGRVPREQARVWVQALDAVVVPRKDLEVSRTVTPQKPAEALALGRPVIVSDLPALRETVQNDAGDQVGITFAAGDPRELASVISETLLSPQRRRELADQGRRAAAERTWPAMMRRYERVYRSVARSGAEETISGE